MTPHGSAGHLPASRPQPPHRAESYQKSPARFPAFHKPSCYRGQLSLIFRGFMSTTTTVASGAALAVKLIRKRFPDDWLRLPGRSKIAEISAMARFHDREGSYTRNGYKILRDHERRPGKRGRRASRGGCDYAVSGRAFMTTYARGGSEPNNRLDGQTTKSTRIFRFGTTRFSAGYGPR